MGLSEFFKSQESEVVIALCISHLTTPLILAGYTCKHHKGTERK